jgi:hypothetical protein
MNIAWQDHSIRAPVDPYGQPGYLCFNESNPLATSWKPYNTAILPALDWMQHIRVAANLPLPLINASYGTTMQDRVNRIPQDRHTNLYPNLESSPETQSRLQRESLDMIRHLQNSTLLLLGDSLDRNTVWHLAQNLASEASLVHPQYANASDYDFENHLEWDISGIPHLLNLKGPLSMAITNCFLYGLVSASMASFMVNRRVPIECPCAAGRI